MLVQHHILLMLWFDVEMIRYTTTLKNEAVFWGCGLM